MKLLYIGQRIDRVTSGADQVNKRNQQLLMKIFLEQVTYLEPSVKGVLDKLVFGINRKMIASVKRELDKGEYTHLFIAQSLMGRIAKYVKQNYPSVVIITFFHNIELQYAQEYLRITGIRTLPFYLSVKLWERVGCQNTDKFITLNKRDSALLKKIYDNDTSIELPTSFEDKFDEEQNQKLILNESDQIDYLFVGVAFFANIQGVQWFIDNVMPSVKGHFHVVGKGMDNVNFKNVTDNIHIHGYVDELAEFYYKAGMVVSPIFVGGGMKTKTAEALMFGKTIVGTSEAFEGYIFDSRCMHLCSNAEDFVETINSLNGIQKFNKQSRELYNNNYSTIAAHQKLRQLF